MIVTIICVSAAVALCVGLVLFLLFYYGLVNSYHPLRKAKDGQIRIACVGDSITYGCMVKNRRKNNYPAVLDNLAGEEYCVNNFAYTNRTAIKSGDYPLTDEKIYRKSIEFKPNAVFILLGTNDSKKRNWNKEEFVRDYCELVESYRSNGRNPKIFLMLPPPLFEFHGKVRYGLRQDVVAEEVIPSIKRVATLCGAECVDLYSVFENNGSLFADGVHPNAEGSKLIAEKAFAALKGDAVS